MKLQQLILVNEQDEPTGVMEKLEVHQKGLLHRAFSIFIFNSKGELLLQRRALHKYHSGGLWTNTCCSHPSPDEDILVAAHRRLKDEMGFSAPLEKIFDFIYKADFNNGLTEYEFDHVFAGKYDGTIKYNKDEVMECEYKNLADIRIALSEHAGEFSQWFVLAFPKAEEWWQQSFKL